MNGIEVKGRGLRKPRPQLSTTGTGALLLRIDDEGHPSFWLEATIPYTLLDALLDAETDPARPAPPPGDKPPNVPPEVFTG